MLIKLITADSFVVVKLCGKKIVRHYIAKIISINQNGLYTVSFMKKVTSRHFEFPEKPDISTIELGDIMKVLSKPHINELKNTYFFENYLEGFSHLY